MAIYCPAKRNYALYLDCKECSDSLCDAFFCLVVGSRSFEDYHMLADKLDLYLKNQRKVVIVSGGARGADALAERYAKERGLQCIIFPADWSRLGKRAGYIRNKEMHEFVSKMKKRGCVAFWNGISKGTRHSIELSGEYKTPVKIVQF